MKIIIHGQPITKKNSQQIIMAGKRPCIIQSKAYRTYEQAAKQQLSSLKLSAWIIMGLRLPIAGPVEVKCLYYLATTRTPDLCNLMAATHDVLEHCGIILNDEQIKSVDGSRIMGKDANPRVEIEINEML